MGPTHYKDGLMSQNSYGELDAVACPPAGMRKPTGRPPVSGPVPGMPGLMARYGGGAGLSVACTLLALPLSGRVDPISIAMLYMLVMCAAGIWLGRGPSALAAVLNTLSFDYFFVPPRFSLLVLDTGYFLTFAVMLIVGMVIAHLMIAVREQTETSRKHERNSTALYKITRDLAVLQDAPTMTLRTAHRLQEELDCDSYIYLCDPAGRLQCIVASEQSPQLSAVDRLIAEWSILQRSRAGMGTDHYSHQRGLYLPILGEAGPLGVLIIKREGTREASLLDSQELLGALVNQLGSALDRVRLADVAHRVQLEVQRAALRNTLLASISHDLRTPLSAIAAAGGILAQSDLHIEGDSRVTLGRLVEDKARAMTAVLTNVLDLVRLESGEDPCERDWHALIDLVGAALCRHDSCLGGRLLLTQIPDEFPLLRVDATLMTQVIGNLLENASKYTPPDATVRLTAQRSASGCILLIVEDSGPGWGVDDPDVLFEKFSRGRRAADHEGIGLGLSICRAIVQLHGGSIHALRSALGGAKVLIELPLPEPHQRDAALVS